MNPIPYEPVPGDAFGPMALKIGICVVIFLLGVAVFFLGNRSREEPKEGEEEGGFQVISGLIGLFMVLGSFIAGAMILSIPSMRLFPTQEQTRAHVEAVQEEVQKTYGLELKPYQVEALNYPNEAPKGQDFLLYGSFKESKPVEGRDFAFDSRTIYLVWSDGKLGLSESVDGESFTPITTKQEAK